MKLFNTFALLAALAFASVGADEIKIGVTFDAGLHSGANVGDAMLKAAIASGEGAAEAIDPVVGGRRLELEAAHRKLPVLPTCSQKATDWVTANGIPTTAQIAIVLSDCTFNFFGTGLIVTSLDFHEVTVDCDPFLGLPADAVCVEVRLFIYAAVVGPASEDLTVNTDAVDDNELANIIRTRILALEPFIDMQQTVTNSLRAVVNDAFSVQAEGDPHFKTWSGNWFDFMGECDMKMIHAPHFDGEGKALDVDIRTKIRYDYSFIESAAIKLGNDTLEVASYGDYFLNGVAGATMPAFVGGYPVTHFNPSKKIHIFEVAIGDKEKIVVKTFKDLVAVTVNDVEPKRFTGALGMTGSHDMFGKMIGRDGQTEITDPTDFANEWQIRSEEPMLFHVAKGPQHPEQCKLPTVSTSEKRRRLGEGLAREKAERACAHFSGEHFENCVFDVMAVGDIEIAQAGVY